MTKHPVPGGEPEPASSSWYLLIHQLPPRPLYLRAKIRHQLFRVGAVPVKKSVYALPQTAECLEDFEWIAQEAVTGGGEATVCRADFVHPQAAEALRARSRELRDGEYQELLEELTRSGAAEAAAAVARARARFHEIRGLDFFDAPKGRLAEKRIVRLEKGGRRMRTEKRPRPGVVSRSSLAGKVWVTRSGVKVDRIASAWLVRRFLDAKAKFRFEAAPKPHPSREISFDAVGADFTHEGDRCTFETLLLRSGIQDGAVREIAEIVHDIDLKDAKFGRAEAAGVSQILTGLFAATSDDSRRLTEGFSVFDQLYRSFSEPSLSGKRKGTRR